MSGNASIVAIEIGSPKVMISMCRMILAIFGDLGLQLGFGVKSLLVTFNEPRLVPVSKVKMRPRVRRLPSEGRGHKFESCRVRQTSNPYSGAYTTMHPRHANSFAVVAT